MTSPMEMDPSVAKRLFDEGGILIIAGVPVGTEFGIDSCSYNIDERFRGIKMIPPGPHFIYCASQGLYGDSAPRVGFIHFFKQSEIVVREWDPNNEELRERQIDDPELEKRRISDNIKQLDKFLAPYDYRQFKQWRNLTDTITEDVIKRCAPECGIVRTNIELLSCPDSERPRGGCGPSRIKAQSGKIDESDLLPNLKPVPGTAPRFTILPDRIRKGASPEEISKNYMDSIDSVELLMKSFSQFNLLIEEIQLSFILFRSGCSLDALAHWRKILNILSNSESAIDKYKLFYMKYLEVLQYELPELPEELMEQNDKNTVYKDVRMLILNCTLNCLTVSAEKLSRNLNKSMKWSFDGLLDDDPEDMPVLVET